ncbi:hypothetical protein BJ165DRAFT_1529400 [Panaeolus papilionaceus]|nr:hypothetical protein BJ165DRAFT_1529400 [Panaeolus papilionaceus]
MSKISGKRLKNSSTLKAPSKNSGNAITVTAIRQKTTKQDKTARDAEKINSDSLCDPDIKPVFSPIHAVHLAELNLIWPANPRIPTIASRRAWCAARNLDPRQVNRWWWKCKQTARTRRIFVPDENYELDVGIPPEIPLEVDVKLEAEDIVDTSHPPSDATLTSDDSTMSFTRSQSKGKRPVPLTARILRSNARLFADVAPSSSRLSSPVASSLPSSSPPPECRRSSSPIATSDTLLDLKLETDVVVPLSCAYATTNEDRPETPVPSLTADLDLCALLDINPVPYNPADYEFPSVDCAVSLDPACYTFSSPDIPSCNIVDMNTRYPTWCFSGFRVCFDGSIIGVCGCS